MRKTAILTIIALSSLLISGCTQKNTDNTIDPYTGKVLDFDYDAEHY